MRTPEQLIDLRGRRGNLRTAREAFGNPTLSSLLNYGILPSNDTPQQVDARFYDWVRDRFDLPSQVDPELFVRDQFARAGRVVSEFATLIDGKRNNRLQPLDGAVSFPDHAHNLIDDMRSDSADTVLRFERQRQANIAMMLGIDYAREARFHTGAAIDSLLSKTLRPIIQGKPGERERRKVFSLHDNDTNLAVSFHDGLSHPIADDPSVLPKMPNTHIKYHDLDICYTESGIPFVRRRRPKNAASLVGKTIDYALRKGEAPETTLASIEDRAQAMFITPWDDSEGSQIKELEALVLAQLGEEGDSSYKVVHMEPKQTTEGKGGPPNDPQFSRWLCYVRNGNSKVDMGFELIFSTGVDHLNYEYHVGEFNERRQRYTGIGHDLYAAKRAMGAEDGSRIGVGEWMFPQYIHFPDGNESADSLLVERQHEIARSLREAQRLRR